MNQGSSNRGSGYGDDRDDDRYSDEPRDDRRATQREGRQQQGGSHWQRQQQADSGGWLAHRQPGSGTDWQGGAAQQGGGADWQSSQQGNGVSGGMQGGMQSRPQSGRYEDDVSRYGSDTERSGYSGDPERMESQRYGGYRVGDRGARAYGQESGQAYGEGRYGQYGEAQRERWGDWHQGQGGERRGNESRGPGRWDEGERDSMWDEPRGARGGWESRQRGQWPERSRMEAPWHTAGATGATGESGRSRPDMRTHYTGMYGVMDYEGDPRDEMYGERSDDRAYEQFTGANERSRLNRGYGGAGGSAAARAQRVAPKGYQRSDERIREDLCERLTYSGRLDVHDVEVSVSNCVVTLSGTVPDRQQKYRIEDMAEDIFGVKDVQNQLRVQRESSERSERRASGLGSSGGATGSGASSYGGGLEAGKSGQATTATDPLRGMTTPTKSGS